MHNAICFGKFLNVRYTSTEWLMKPLARGISVFKRIQLDTIRDNVCLVSICDTAYLFNLLQVVINLFSLMPNGLLIIFACLEQQIH